jgi:hypothetical protein
MQAKARNRKLKTTQERDDSEQADKKVACKEGDSRMDRKKASSQTKVFAPLARMPKQYEIWNQATSILADLIYSQH